MPSRSGLSAAERRLYSKLRLLLNEPGLIRGNLVVMKRGCGKAACRCHSEPDRRHAALYLGLRVDGKQRMVYIPAKWEELVRQWVGRYSEVRDVLEQISLKFLDRLRHRKG